MITSEDKRSVLTLISEACQAGATKSKAAQLLGLTVRTIQRWKKQGTTDKRKDSRAVPANKLSGEEQDNIVNVLKSREYADFSPNQIVPKLADQGIYMGSESTMYRILRTLRMNEHRQASNPVHRHSPETFTACGPNQIWSWDITYLRSPVKGQFYYLYMVMDLYSRKAVACQVYESESGEFASDLITDACIREKISKKQVILHSDNGSPMKSATMLAKLQDLGVMPSFSRPSVSNDNPFSESLFRTMKYRPNYPEKPFENVMEARAWANDFVTWYNTVHLHSSINFVTPDDRHRGKDVQILENRHKVYLKARLKNPERWSKETRDWKAVTEVSLKKFKRLKPEISAEKRLFDRSNLAGR